MALPTAPSFASFDVTARTEGRAVDSVLWDSMYAISRAMEVIGTGPTIKQQRYEWIGLGADPTFVTAQDHGGATTIDGHATNAVLAVTEADADYVQEGTILVNASRATPCATTNAVTNRNELLQVTAKAAADSGYVHLTVTRDAGAFNSGNGSTAHTHSDKFRILYTPLQEGSSAASDPNTYVADTILENYTFISSMKMQLTGSQKARAMEVVDSEVERQWARSLGALKNKMCNAMLYGYNSATAVGSDTVIRNMKGLKDFLVDNLVTAQPLVDYTTTTLTYDSINALLVKLAENGADPSGSNLKILTSYQTKDLMGSWEYDKVRTTLNEEQVGKEVSIFKSTLGFQLEIIADSAVEKNDFFILDPSKIKWITFRPFEKSEWGKGTSAPNGDDMWYQRTIGEHTLQVVDPGVAHACFSNLSW